MSKIERKYKDYYGNARSLFWMVRNEPQWAESRILCCESAEAELETLQAALAAKDAELATCQRLYSEQRDRKNQYAEELSALSNDRNAWFDKALELSRELAHARKHSGKCVECGAWTCGYCGISDSEGKWHCKTCQP